MEWCWAADSEISNAYQKYQGDKAWIYKYPGSAERHDLQIGIVGAGDASFIQYAAERINGSFEELYERPRGHTTMPEASAIIQGILNDLHHNHLYPVPAAYEQPRVELILGLWLGNQRNRLAKTYLTAMTKIWNHDAVGIGSPLANFIIKRFYGGRVTVAQAVFISTQVLMHVKQNVPACGGQSKIIAMFKNGNAGFIRAESIAEHEKFLANFDRAIEPVFFGGPDESVTNDVFSQRVDAMSRDLKALRKLEDIQQRAAQVPQTIVLRPEPAVLNLKGRTPTVVITPSEIQPSDRPANQSDRQSPKRGRKSQPPSRA